MDPKSAVVQQMRHSLREVVREWGLMHAHPCVPELTLPQGHALIEIEARGSMAIAELAKILNLDHSSVSRLVSRLVQKKFLNLVASKQDARVRLLSLTETGRKVLSRLHDESDRKVRDGLILMSDEQQEIVLNGMRIYARALKQARGQTGTVIRPIEKRDESQVASVIRLVMPEFGASGPGFALHDPEVDFMAKAYNKKKHGYFVIEMDGKVVGGGGFGPLKGGKGGVCELRKMYLLPEARGYGLGEKLLKLCLLEAKRKGFDICYLETTSKMVQAQALYQKLGFKPLSSPLGNTGHCGCDRWYQKKL